MTRNSWLVAFGIASLFAGACSSRRAAPEERLGTASSALFANGLPCSTETQCTSNNCVDGVCCDTPCGGGLRDLQACSNVYGAVPGLVNGTCKTLTVGQSCGTLTTVNPCTWRGTVVNGGGQCPNPPGGASACFPCANSGDCSGAFPVCVDNACVQCTGNAGSATAAPCPATAPTCSAGVCTQCTAASADSCVGTTPTCNAATGACAACNGDNGSGATRECRTAAARACLADGSCVACSATNATACTGTTPACDTGTNTCAACNGDNGSAATLKCPTAGNPHCFGPASAAPGTCGKCTGAADCVGNPAGTSCNTVSGSCGAGCVNDVDCPGGGTQWCAAGVCTAKTANGELLPATAPINGTCNAANGAKVCQSGVCDIADNRCGLPNGANCGPPTTDARCRTGTCFPADNKCGLPPGQGCVTQDDCRSLICPPSGKCGNCTSDASCGLAASGQVCDDLAKTCGAGCRGTGGNTCPAGLVCTSADATIGKCVQCEVDTTCGNATSGRVCNPTTKMCQAGCRGADGNGCPAGQPCTSGDATIGLCQQCTTDVNCGAANSGQVCNAQKQCQAGCRGTGGNTCMAGQVCSSTDNTIGACTTPGVDAGVDSGVDAGPTGCTTDPDCGGPTSGRLCNQTTKTCADGCRGQGGNGCRQGQVCSSTTSSAGVCAPATATPVVDDAILEGGGLACSAAVAGGGSSGHAGLAFAGIALALVTARRRRASASA